MYHVVYEYEVGGIRHTSKRVNHSANYKTIASATVKKYPAGANVPVFYHASNPEQAVLEKKEQGMWIWFQLFAAVVFAGMLCSVIFK